MPAQDGRQLCILYLSALADGMRWLLPMADEFSRTYELIPYVSYEAHRLVEHKPVPDDQIANCDLLLCHDPSAMTLAPGQREAYEAFLSRFSPRCRRVTFGNPLCDVLWPFRADDPRNEDPARPPNAHGELPTYPFGDAFVLERLNSGMPREEIIREYLALDIASVVDLAKLLEDNLARMTHNEQNCDVKISEFVAQNFRREKLFSAASRPGNALFLQVTNATLAAIGVPSLPLSLEQLQLLVKVEAPIHPSIGRYFDATYIGDDVRYRIDRRRYLTFAEYLSDYVYFA